MPWQPAPMLYPDAELVLTTALRAALTAYGRSDVLVSRSVSSAKPLVVLTRDGGATEVLRDRPRIRIRTFAATAQAATDLARLVNALLLGLPGSNGILRAEILSGPYEIPDASGPLRYALAEFHIRGEELT